MSDYDNTNRGVLFDNDRKELDTHPDMTGSININGVEHWFSGWWKEGKRGEFLSLSIGKPKDAPRQQAPQQPQRRGNRPSNRGNGGGYSDDTRQQQRPRQTSGGFDDMPDEIPY